MPTGAAVITNINAIVDQRAPETMLRVTAAAAEASQMTMMNCFREKVVSVISTLLRVGFERKAPQEERRTVDGREPASQRDLSLRSGPKWACRRAPDGVLLERWLAQCGTTLPTIPHSTG